MASHSGGHLELRKMHKGDFWGLFGIRPSAFCNFIPGSCFFSLMLLHYNAVSRGYAILSSPPKKTSTLLEVVIPHSARNIDKSLQPCHQKLCSWIKQTWTYSLIIIRKLLVLLVISIRSYQYGHINTVISIRSYQYGIRLISVGSRLSHSNPALVASTRKYGIIMAEQQGRKNVFSYPTQ